MCRFSDVTSSQNLVPLAKMHVYPHHTFLTALTQCDVDHVQISTRLSLRFSFGRVKGHTQNYCVEGGRAWRRGYHSEVYTMLTFHKSVTDTYILTYIHIYIHCIYIHVHTKYFRDVMQNYLPRAKALGNEGFRTPKACNNSALHHK